MGTPTITLERVTNDNTSADDADLHYDSAHFLCSSLYALADDALFDVYWFAGDRILQQENGLFFDRSQEYAFVNSTLDPDVLEDYTDIASVSRLDWIWLGNIHITIII